VNLTTHAHLVPRLIITGLITQLPPTRLQSVHSNWLTFMMIMVMVMMMVMMIMIMVMMMMTRARISMT
jgi:hypothetical protein